MAIRSAGSRFCTTKLWLAAIFCLASQLPAQLTTGTIEGVLQDAQHHVAANTPIAVEGGAGVRTTIHTDAQGRFTATLPYGQYRFAATSVTVVPLTVTHLDLTTGAATPAGFWLDTTRGGTYPEGFNLSSVLLNREPSTVTQPLDFTGVHDNRLAVESQGGASWTVTQFRLQGMDATDSYQPGRPAILPNIADMSNVTAHDNKVGLFLAEPGEKWHATLSNGNTGAPLTSSNLPASNLGLVQQSDYFKWLTRDGLAVGGPIGKRADVFASAWGQWGSQTVPLAPPGNDQNSRLLFADARGRVRVTDRDQLEALYSGSRIDLSNEGTPAGIEAYAGNRMAPSFTLPGGFPGQEEVDHLDFVQTAWTHMAHENSRAGILQVRYGYSTAHLDSALTGQGPLQQQSRIELTTSVVSGAPPLGNFAIRTRQSVTAAWQPQLFSTGFIRHRIAIGGSLEVSTPRNRFSTPSNMNLITANGAPAFVMDFNTPADTSASIASTSGYISDQMQLGRLSADIGVVIEHSRGSVQGISGALISWNTFSPHVALAWSVPHTHGAILRAAYSRVFSPLAGRYLDFGDPHALSGAEYRWTDANSNGWFDAGEQGQLLTHFGGAYSSISPALRQPYADHFNVGAEVTVAPRTVATVDLFRIDARQRIAALDVGVPAQAYSPVTMNDPGPDGIAGTFDDHALTVYAQNPTTFGQDRYLLTNPDGLNARNMGFVAQLHSAWRGFAGNASFTAEKSNGATNPGNAAYENDPGVVGSLLLDPNTSINAANRFFMDRAYVGKIFGTYRIPWAGIEFSTSAVYMDGLAFGRELLVTALPQGPLLVAATVRGSPEGGNRAEHLVNWNSGFRRSFRLGVAVITVRLDVMNVSNAAHRIQESDITGTSFNLRLPVAIQAPRSVNPGFTLTF